MKIVLEYQNNATKFDYLEQNPLYGVNVWVVYIVGQINWKSFLRVADKCPLKFDSHIFEFLDALDGRFQKMNKLQNAYYELYISKI